MSYVSGRVVVREVLRCFVCMIVFESAKNFGFKIMKIPLKDYDTMQELLRQ